MQMRRYCQGRRLATPDKIGNGHEPFIIKTSEIEQTTYLPDSRTRHNVAREEIS
jgi:hypothetical protein